MEHYPECQAPCCPWMPQPCDCQCTCADIAVIEQRALKSAFKAVDNLTDFDKDCDEYDQAVADALEAINELISQSKRYGEYEGPS